MRRTVHKWFWAWDFEEEERWLNQMSVKGLSLVAVGYCKYTFEDTSPSQYTIRLELLENTATHIESTQYIKFIEETGGEYLGSVKRWVYFRRRNELGNFNIYSDIESRIKHFSRIVTPLGIIGGLNLLIAINVGMYNLPSSLQFLKYICILNFSSAILCGYGCIKILIKKKKLQKEKNLFE